MICFEESKIAFKNDYSESNVFYGKIERFLRQNRFFGRSEHSKFGIIESIFSFQKCPIIVKSQPQQDN